MLPLGQFEQHPTGVLGAFDQIRVKVAEALGPSLDEAIGHRCRGSEIDDAGEEGAGVALLFVSLALTLGQFSERTPE